MHWSLSFARQCFLSIFALNRNPKGNYVQLWSSIAGMLLQYYKLVL